MSRFQKGDKVILTTNEGLYGRLAGLTGIIHGKHPFINSSYLVWFSMSSSELRQRLLIQFRDQIHDDGDNKVFRYMASEDDLCPFKKRILTPTESVEYLKLLDCSNRSVIDEFMISSYES